MARGVDRLEPDLGLLLGALIRGPQAARGRVSSWGQGGPWLRGQDFCNNLPLGLESPSGPSCFWRLYRRRTRAECYPFASPDDLHPEP